MVGCCNQLFERIFASKLRTMIGSDWFGFVHRLSDFPRIRKMLQIAQARAVASVPHGGKLIS